MTLRTEATMIPQQGVSVANYVYTTIPLFAQASDIGFFKNAQFQLYKKLYDQYRVVSVSVRVKPKANVLDQQNAQNEANTAHGDGLIHSVIDRDGPASMNVQTLTRYPSYKKHSVLKPFSRSYSVKWPSDTWLTTNETFPDSVALVKQIGGLGGIYIYGENLLEDSGEVFNEPYASIEVLYKVIFRGQISTNFGYDPETDVITLSPPLLGALPAPSGLVNLKGTINDTAAYTNLDEPDAKTEQVAVDMTQKADD